MTYLAHGITLALAWFLAATATCSVAAAVVGRSLLARRSRAAGPDPEVWFALRLGPSIAAFAFVAAVFVPSYWLFEPRNSVERFDVTLSACALVVVAMVALAGGRGLFAARAVRRRTRVWLQTATRLPGLASAVPTFLVHTPSPLMALVGIVRPRVFVSAPLVAALTPDELSATIAHELAHWRAADNLKRLAIRMAPDFLGGTSVARGIERRWAAAAERAADDRGTRGDVALRCALAAALVKVARLMPQPVPQLEPLSTLDGGGDLTLRIERLLGEPPSNSHGMSRARLLAATAVVLAVTFVSYGPLLRAIHDATELLVNSLP